MSGDSNRESRPDPRTQHPEPGTVPCDRLRVLPNPFPISPPIEPMLAKLAEELPTGDGFLYEPKWDGFRAIVFRGGSDVFIQSRDSAAARSLLSGAARRLSRSAAGRLRPRRRDRDRDAARPRFRRAADAAASGGFARRQAGEGNAGVVRRIRSARGRWARPARASRSASAARCSSGCSPTSSRRSISRR